MREGDVISEAAALAGTAHFCESFTRDLSLASGTQAVTGVGFKPTALLFYTADLSGGAVYVSITCAAPNIATGRGVFNNRNAVTGTWFRVNNALLIQHSSGSGDSVFGDIQSYDADGFTVSWTKNGTPTDTVQIGFMAFK
jgi:hypothetical protein